MGYYRDILTANKDPSPLKIRTWILSFRENAPCPPFTTDTIASNTIRLELLEPKLQLREQLAIPDRK